MASGDPHIQSVNAEYQQRERLSAALAARGLSDPNPHRLTLPVRPERGLPRRGVDRGPHLAARQGLQEHRPLGVSCAESGLCPGERRRCCPADRSAGPAQAESPPPIHRQSSQAVSRLRGCRALSTPRDRAAAKSPPTLARSHPPLTIYRCPQMIPSPPGPSGPSGKGVYSPGSGPWTALRRPGWSHRPAVRPSGRSHGRVSGPFQTMKHCFILSRCLGTAGCAHERFGEHRPPPLSNSV